MKTLLTLFTLFISSLTFAQKFVVTPIGIRNESDNEKTYVVSDIENKNAAELYSNALKYIVKNYKNPEKVIIGKVENESLKFQTFVRAMLVIKYSVAKVPIDAEYSNHLDFKDNKVKFEIQGLDMYYSPDLSKTRVLFTGGITGGYSIYNKKGELKLEETKTDIEFYFNNEILKIAAFLSGKEVGKADW